MKRIQFAGLAGLATTGLAFGVVRAQECCTPIVCPVPVAVECAPAPVVEQYVLQEHTEMVPVTTMRRQRVQSTVYQAQQRPRTQTVYEQVAEYVNVPTQQTVMAQKVVMQPQTVTTMQAYYRDVQVQTPVQTYENQQVEREVEVTRNVAHEVKFRVNRTIVQRIEIPGHPTQERVLRTEPGQCQTRTEMRPQTFREKQVGTVQVPKTVMQTQTQKVLDYRPVQTTQHVPVVVAVPEVQAASQQVLQYRSVPRTVTTMESVSVPVVVEHEVDVPQVEYVPVRRVSYVPASSLIVR